jgi:hypothetical protein
MAHECLLSCRFAVNVYPDVYTRRKCQSAQEVAARFACAALVSPLRERCTRVPCPRVIVPAPTPRAPRSHPAPRAGDRCGGPSGGRRAPWRWQASAGVSRPGQLAALEPAVGWRAPRGLIAPTAAPSILPDGRRVRCASGAAVSFGATLAPTRAERPAQAGDRRSQSRYQTSVWPELVEPSPACTTPLQ